MSAAFVFVRVERVVVPHPGVRFDPSTKPEGPDLSTAKRFQKLVPGDEDRALHVRPCRLSLECPRFLKFLPARSALVAARRPLVVFSDRRAVHSRSRCHRFTRPFRGWRLRTLTVGFSETNSSGRTRSACPNPHDREQPAEFGHDNSLSSI